MNVTGATSCITCLAGRFAASYQNSFCQPCDPGMNDSSSFITVSSQRDSSHPLIARAAFVVKIKVHTIVKKDQ
jgi:hypothetical protein